MKRKKICKFYYTTHSQQAYLDIGQQANKFSYSKYTIDTTNPMKNSHSEFVRYSSDKTTYFLRPIFVLKMRPFRCFSAHTFRTKIGRCSCDFRTLSRMLFRMKTRRLTYFFRMHIPHEQDISCGFQHINRM